MGMRSLIYVLTQTHGVYIQYSFSVDGTASYSWDVIEYNPVNNLATFRFQKVRVLCMLLGLYYNNSGNWHKIFHWSLPCYIPTQKLQWQLMAYSIVLTAFFAVQVIICVMMITLVGVTSAMCILLICLVKRRPTTQSMLHGYCAKSPLFQIPNYVMCYEYFALKKAMLFPQ